MPVVSAIMVFHRDQPYLRPAIASVLGQSWRDLELVLVDNGTGLSPDALGELGRDPRVRWVRLAHNAGFALGLNAGVAAAGGEFVALTDSDDLSRPHRFERQVAALRADPGLALLTSAADTIDETGAVTGREFNLVTERDQRVFGAYTMPAPTPSVLGRRDVFLRYPCRPEFSSAADYDFFTRVADRGRTAGLTDVLLHYRRHAAQSTVEQSGEQQLGACRIRLMTARRRSGRDENPEDLLAEDGSGPMADHYARFAQRCVAEGFGRLAVYHARKLLAARRTVRDLRAAGAVLAAAVRSEPRVAPLLVRLFFTGPLRAHGLRPA
jgi:glycosyltransferase involved in cell wall biosynthesis